MLRTFKVLNYTVNYDDTDVSSYGHLRYIIIKASCELSKLRGIIDVTWDFLNDSFIVSLFDYDHNFIEEISFHESDVTYDTDDDIPF